MKESVTIVVSWVYVLSVELWKVFNFICNSIAHWRRMVKSADIIKHSLSSQICSEMFLKIGDSTL